MRNSWRRRVWIGLLLLLPSIASAQQAAAGAKTLTFDNDPIGSQPAGSHEHEQDRRLEHDAEHTRRPTTQARGGRCEEDARELDGEEYPGEPAKSQRTDGFCPSVGRVQPQCIDGRRQREGRARVGQLEAGQVGDPIGVEWGVHHGLSLIHI